MHSNSSSRQRSTQPFRARCAHSLDLLLLLVAFGLLLSPDWGRSLSRAVALVLLSSWALLRSRQLDARRLIGPVGLLGAAGLALVLLGESEYSWAIGGCALMGAVGGLWHPAGAPARSLALAAALVGVAWTAHLLSPWACVPLRDAWMAWSRAVGQLFGRDWRVGPSFQGASLLLPSLALIVARFALVERRPRRILVGLASIALGTVLQLGWIELAAPRVSTSFASLLPWLAAGPVVFLAASVLVSLPSNAAVPRGAPRSGWMLALGSCAALAVGLCSHLVAPTETPRVLLYSVEEGPILNWERPRYGAYGAYELGLFGLLAESLEADGFEVAYLRERITPEHLEGVDALVAINARTEWAEDELFTVWSYVHDGGNLLVMGDHTGADGSLACENDLLAPTGIQFQFDSAVPAGTRGWGGSDLYFHQLNANVERPAALGIAVGGSLRLERFGALPLVVGRQGLADRGDAQAPERNFLGDYRYQPGEPLGDCVLVAWSRLGAGKVLVQGDTSGFQNTLLEATYEPFVRDSFGWITGTTVFDLGLAGSVAASVLFGLCVLGSVFLLRGEGVQPAFLPLLLWATVAGGRAAVGELLAREPLALPTALIDDSHLPRTEAGVDRPRSLDGFKNTVLRSGYRPVTMDTFSEAEIARAELFVTVAPVQAYDADELEVLERYMDRGGFVIACASHPESSGLSGLLERVGLEVLPRPIGSIPLERTEGRPRVQVEYVDAWQVGVSEAAEVPPPWVYGDLQGLPLAMLARHGKGGLFLVGDSQFFGAANLEAIHEYSEPNILFLRSLLSDLEDLREEVVQ